jgi:hypothetical protein
MVIKPLPPGPAFIQSLCMARSCYSCADTGFGCPQVLEVPRDYVWQAATIGTAAGWVRPIGKLKAVPLVDYPKVDIETFVNSL